jgi:hypothetical protein
LLLLRSCVERALQLAPVCIRGGGELLNAGRHRVARGVQVAASCPDAPGQLCHSVVLLASAAARAAAAWWLARQFGASRRRQAGGCTMRVHTAGCGVCWLRCLLRCAMSMESFFSL